MTRSEVSSARNEMGLPAQSVRRFAKQLLSDRAEIDDLVEEILGACIAEFVVYDRPRSGDEWVMRVALRIVDERWRGRTQAAAC